jgi:class 3 adenylate cyclase
MSRLPSGTVTFLLTDVEGSTELLQRLGPAYPGELAAHRTIVRGSVERSGGEVVDQRGEEAFAAHGRAGAVRRGLPRH